MSKCEDCGTEIINGCLKCGAPQCCPKCCANTLTPETYTELSPFARRIITDGFNTAWLATDSPKSAEWFMGRVYGVLAEVKSAAEVKGWQKAIESVGETLTHQLEEAVFARDTYANSVHSAMEMLSAYVPESADSKGKPLTLADKITLLGQMYEDVRIERDRLLADLRSIE